MRRRFWIVIVPCLAGILTSPAGAAVVAVEDFEAYAADAQLHTLNGPGGWLGPWTVPVAGRRSEATIASVGLNYSLGDVLVSGGNRSAQYAATETSAAVLATRQLPSQPGSVLYSSFLYQSTANPDGQSDDFFQVGFNNAPGEPGGNPKVSFADQNNLLNVRSNTGSQIASPISSTTGNTYFIVLRAEKTGVSTTYNDLRLYVNPVSRQESFNPFTLNTTNSTLDLSSAAYAVFRKAFAETGDTFRVDQLRVGTTFADVLPTRDGTFSITTRSGNGADAYVHTVSPNTNFGATTYMQVKAGNEPGTMRKGYMRFDLSQTPWDDYEGARLTLTVDGYGGDANTTANWTFHLYGLNDGFVGSGGELGENWLESAITASNAPGNNLASRHPDLADVYGGAPLATFQLIGGSQLSGSLVTLDSALFPDLVSFLNSDTDGLATFILTRDTAEGGMGNIVHQFYSKEAGTYYFAPILTVWVPEPSSLVLALAGLLGMIGIAWRRRQAARR